MGCQYSPSSEIIQNANKDQGNKNEEPNITLEEPKKIIEHEIDWGNFKVHSIYLSSIYSTIVYGSDGNPFIADGWIYVKDTLLTRMRPDGTEKELLPADVNKFGLYNAVYHNGWIYFIDEKYMYLDVMPPPGTNEHLLRMRPDGTNLQECVRDVFGFEIHGEWVFFQSGYTLSAVKIEEWANSYLLYKSNDEKQDTWLLRTWVIHNKYIFYSINETLGGAGQYNSKMYRMNLNGTNNILLMKNSSIVYDPRFINDGYLYFSSYQSDVGDIIYRMDLDGTNIKTIIKPNHYILLRRLFIRENWLYYEYSWRDNSKPYSQSLNESIRKVRLDGTDDMKTSWSVFGGTSENVTIWPKGNIVIWQITSWVTSGKVTRQYLYIAPMNKTEDAVQIFDGLGWESLMSHYIWNGNVYILIKSWR